MSKALVISESGNGNVIAVLLVTGEVDLHSVRDLAEYYSQSVTEVSAVHLDSTEAVEKYIREELNQKSGEEDQDDLPD